jgi:hypothetical protein
MTYHASQSGGVGSATGEVQMFTVIGASFRRASVILADVLALIRGAAS